MEWIHKQLDWIGGQGTSAQVIGTLIATTILALLALGWRRLVLRKRRAEVESVKAESEEPPKSSDPLTLSERRVLAKMYKGKREIRILRTDDSPALFVRWSGYVESDPTSLVADRWFFVLKGLAARELVSHRKEKQPPIGYEVDVFRLNENGLERCIALFGGPCRAAANRAVAWLVEWWFLLAWFAVLSVVLYCVNHEERYGTWF